MRPVLPLAAAVAAMLGAVTVGTGPASAAAPRGLFSTTVTFTTAGPTYATNGPLTFTRTSTGRYTFSAANLGGTGIPQLTVWDTGGPLPICTVSSVTRLASSTRLKVRCANPQNGAPADAVFSLLYTSLQTSAPSIHHVQLATGSTASHTPANQFRSAGSGKATVKRLATGRYRVRIPNETFASNGGVVMTTATSSNPRWCNPSYWVDNGAGGTDVTVECHRRGGAYADSTFSLIATAGSVLGTPGVAGGSAWSLADGRGLVHTPISFYSWNSAGRTNTDADQVLTGSAEVTFPDAFPAGGSFIIKLAVAYGPHRCAHQGLHGLDGDDVTLAVACQQADGTPVDSSFDVMLAVLVTA